MAAAAALIFGGKNAFRNKAERLRERNRAKKKTKRPWRRQRRPSFFLFFVLFWRER